MGEEFVVKDSGARQSFDSGMVRDTQDGKIEWHRIFEGPMAKRLAVHLTKGATKYPDNEDGTANWTKANSPVEYRRFKQSAARHFAQWLAGERDEDHAAAVMFNINGAEYTLDTYGSEVGEPIDVVKLEADARREVAELFGRDERVVVHGETVSQRMERIQEAVNYLADVAWESGSEIGEEIERRRNKGTLIDRHERPDW